jgi:XTP/dITP diphosphohydrolase
MKRSTIFFATSNPHKVAEIRFVLRNYPLEIQHVNIKGVEIQTESVDAIAQHSALLAMRNRGIPVFVEDTGLFIDALKGFPGPYASHAYRTIGISGVLQLLVGETNRGATFRSAVAFCDLDETITCFLGECRGKISQKPRGTHGFGFDPIFEPDHGKGKTFGEMTRVEKSAISHRSHAVRHLADWYVKRFTDSQS